MVDKTAYGLRIPLTKVDLLGGRTPLRGDIAVFDSPRDGKRLIKRIVAVGGDSVHLRDGQLTINGAPLGDCELERFGGRAALLNLRDGGGPDIGELVVPAGMVLALGDHRGDSVDGRYFGLIDQRELFGRAIAIYYRRDDGFTWLPLEAVCPGAASRKAPLVAIDRPAHEQAEAQDREQEVHEPADVRNVHRDQNQDEACDE